MLTLGGNDFLLKDTEEGRWESDMVNWEMCGPLGAFS